MEYLALIMGNNLNDATPCEGHPMTKKRNNRQPTYSAMTREAIKFIYCYLFLAFILGEC